MATVDALKTRLRGGPTPSWSGCPSDVQQVAGKMAPRRPKVFFDGGCRPNPGPMEAAVVIRGVAHLFDDLGTGSNSDAEWLALIHAIELIQSLGLSDVELIGDAREVVRHADRALQTGFAPPGHAAAFLAVAAKAPPARVRWIKREQNLAGIALAARHPR